MSADFCNSACSLHLWDEKPACRLTLACHAGRHQGRRVGVAYRLRGCCRTGVQDVCHLESGERHQAHAAGAAGGKQLLRKRRQTTDDPPAAGPAQFGALADLVSVALWITSPSTQLLHRLQWENREREGTLPQPDWRQQSLFPKCCGRHFQTCIRQPDDGRPLPVNARALGFKRQHAQ